VKSVAAKRRALRSVAAIPGIDGIVDRLRVRAGSSMSDDGILDHLRKSYLMSPAFQGCRLLERRGGSWVAVNDGPEDSRGEIMVEVKDAIVTLNGHVPSLTAKRLAGVLAWWVPGSIDVINGIVVEPPEDDAPIRIEEAVRIALETDPLVDASQIRVGARDRTVHLTGVVRSEQARELAESDAWCVFGVDDVINDIEVAS
jgi:osmotically-inducible protein OsmY